MAMITALAVAGGSFAAFGAAKYFEPEIQSEYKSEEESEEQSEEQSEEESEQQSEEEEAETEAEPEPVQQPEETEPVQEPVQEPIQEEQQGGQKGGIGRPTWAAVKQGETIQDVVGIAGSTASNFIAKATGTYKKTPDEIQLSLKNVDDELRVLQVQQFRLNSDYKAELDNFNGIVGTTGIREKYQEILGRKKYFTFMENYYSQKISSFNTSTSQAPPTTNTGNLQEEFDKEFKKDQFVKPVPPSTTALKSFDQWLEDSLRQILGRKKRNFRGESPPDLSKPADVKSWYSNLKNKSVSQQQATNSTPLTFVDYKTNVTNEINASKEKEIATYQESEYKPTYDKSLLKLTELRSRIEEVSSKVKELKNKKELLLTDLSNYETPTFWNKKEEVKKSTLPTGIELQTLLNEYKSIQNKIKDKQDEINDYISLHIEDPDQTWINGEEYKNLNDSKKTLESDLKSTIQKIEGRDEKQQTTLGQLNELDTFIKLLKDNNVKAYKLFETDFRKVYDIIVKLSNDTNILPNLDKYYRFFGRPLNNLKLSSYNGENVDKVMLFFNTYQKIVKDDLKDKITKFLLDFDRYIIKSKNNIQDTISLVQANDPKKLKEELDKLNTTQRAILEGRSPTWQSFLENTPKLNLDFIFKTDLQKLQKIKDNFQKRIVDKLETQNITKPLNLHTLTFEKQKYLDGQPTVPTFPPISPITNPELTGPTLEKKPLTSNFIKKINPKNNEKNDNQIIQVLIDIFTEIPYSREEFEKLNYRELTILFKSLVKTAIIVNELSQTKDNLEIKEQYEILLQFVSTEANKKNIVTTGGANENELFNQINKIKTILNKIQEKKPGIYSRTKKEDKKEEFDKEQDKEEQKEEEITEKCDYSVNDLINFEEKTYQVQSIVRKSGNCVIEMIVKDTEEDEENLFNTKKTWKYYTAFLDKGKIIRLEVLDFVDTTQTNTQNIQNMFNNENYVRELVSAQPSNNPRPPPLQDIGGNHKTRRQGFLSKPSRRKTRRT